MKTAIKFLSKRFFYRRTILFCLTFLSPMLHAGNVPGDINFGLDKSIDNHAYKFRLIVNGGAITFPTGCVAPDTGLAQALSYGAIGVTSARLVIQASDCAAAQDSWINLSGYLDYNSSYWYNVFVNMETRTFYS